MSEERTAPGPASTALVTPSGLPVGFSTVWGSPLCRSWGFWGFRWEVEGWEERIFFLTFPHTWPSVTSLRSPPRWFWHEIIKWTETPAAPPTPNLQCFLFGLTSWHPVLIWYVSWEALGLRKGRQTLRMPASQHHCLRNQEPALGFWRGPLSSPPTQRLAFFFACLFLFLNKLFLFPAPIGLPSETQEAK